MNRPSPVRCLWILLVFGLALTGCDRNIGPFDPGEEPRDPDLSRIFPAPEETAPATAAGPAGSGGQPAQVTPTGRVGAAVRGTLNVQEEVDLGPSSAVFIIARPSGAVGGPPLAVVRIPKPSFPLDFEIGPANVMIPSMKFEGAIDLTARLDADGNASTKGEADLGTASPVAVSPGDAGVELLLQ